MGADLRTIVLLAVLVWGTLAAVVVVLVRMARRPDAGFGGVAHRLDRPLPPRAGITPVAIPPRHVSP
jgi:hypothetical protein